MKLQHLIWALAGSALLLVLALAAWQGGGSREPVNASALVSQPAAVPAAAGFVTPAPDVSAAAPVAVAVVPPASSDGAAAPSASPDLSASDSMTERERVAQQRARVR